MIVIAAGRALEGLESFATIARAVEGSVRDVHGVRIARVGRHAAEIPTAHPEAVIGGDVAPVLACIVRAVNSALVSIHERKDSLAAFTGGDGDSDAAQSLARKSMGRDLPPIHSAVRGLVKAAARPIRGRIDAPRRAARLPQRRIHNLRIARLETEINRAGVVVLCEDLFPARAAIRRAVHAALCIRPKTVPERGNKYDIRIAGVNQYAADLARIAQTDVPPGRAGVG